MSEAKHSPLLPLAYTDGPDYCTVNDAAGNAFALTVQPAALREMEYATSLHHELVAALEATLCELSHCATQLAARGFTGHKDDSVSRAQAAARVVLQKAKQGDKQ